MTKQLALKGGEKSLSLTDIPIDQHSYRKEDLESIVHVLESRKYSMFNNGTVADFEKAIAKYVGTQSAAVVTNCTSALDASLRALQIGNGDEVIMPAYTYAATMMAILSAEAKPVLVDIDYDTLTIDAAKIPEKISARTKAILPVHIFGNPCNMNKICQLASENGLRIIEDCAHSLGAKYDTSMTGSFDVGCHSFGENKILRLGEGGAVTSNPDVIKKVEIIRHEGEIWARTGTSAASAIDLQVADLVEGIDYVARGHNFRYSPLLAALGLSKLEVLPEHINALNCNGEEYDKKIQNIPHLRIPNSFPNTRRIYSSYIILAEGIDRNTLLLALAMEGVPVGVHFPKPLHQTTIYDTFSKDKDLPNAERFCKNHLSLPVYPAIQKEHIERICEVLAYVVDEITKRPDELLKKTKELLPKTPVRQFYSGVYVTV